MTIEERKEREKEEKRNLILDAAKEIVSNEGLEKLSIRKIAGKIDYSPAVIYNYFQNKDEILNDLIKDGYKNIVDALNTVQLSSEKPLDSFKEAIRKYIEVALQNPDEYKAVLLNNTPSILDHTSILINDASIRRKAIFLLCQHIKEINSENNLDDSKIEILAQVVWTATYGLIIRLIIEKDLITEEQKINLIENHIDIMVKGVVI